VLPEVSGCQRRLLHPPGNLLTRVQERTMRSSLLPGVVFAIAVAAAAVHQLPAQTPATDPPAVPPPAKPATDPPATDPLPGGAAPAGDSTPPKTDNPLPELVKLSPEHDIWLDQKRKQVVVEGYVCLRKGALEMLACPEGTKEHESVIALNCKAWQVHAALQALGAKPVHPVKFNPDYVPAKGTIVEIDILWRDEQGNKRKARAQDWVQDHQTGKALEHNWVFGGSQMYRDPMTGQELYLAEDGDLVCVSNFTTATLDLPIASSKEAGQLVYAAFTERIPPRKTRVRLVFRPQLKDDDPPQPPTAVKKP
jgi:hypothetical protein